MAPGAARHADSKAGRAGATPAPGTTPPAAWATASAGDRWSAPSPTGTPDERGPLYTGGRSLRGTLRAGAYGHVAWVQHVHTDGSATVAHYNGAGTRTFSTARVKAPRYLYVGVPVPRS